MDRMKVTCKNISRLYFFQNFIRKVFFDDTITREKTCNKEYTKVSFQKKGKLYKLSPTEKLIDW